MMWFCSSDREPSKEKKKQEMKTEHERNAMIRTGSYNLKIQKVMIRKSSTEGIITEIVKYHQTDVRESSIIID